MTMTKLQNPIRTAFDKVNDGLKAASSAHKKVGRSLDKVSTSWLLHNICPGVGVMFTR